MATQFSFNQDELLRFVLYRPAIRHDADRTTSIPMGNASPFQASLIKAWNDSDDTALKALNTAADSTQAYFKDGDIVLLKKLSDFLRAVRSLDWTPANELKEVTVQIKSAFGVLPADAVATAEFQADVVRLQNSLLFATYYAPYRAGKPLSLLTDLLRATNVVYLAKAPVDAQLSAKFAALPHFTRSVLLQIPIEKPADVKVASLRGKPAPTPSTPAAAAGAAGAGAAVAASATARTAVEPADILALKRKLSALRPDQYYSPAEPDDPWEQAFGSVSESALTAAEKTLLQELNLDFKTQNVQQLIGGLDAAYEELRLPDSADTSSAIVLGSTVINGGLTIAANPPSMTVSTSPLKFKPVGVADLLVVQQHILRYDGGEVAHIDNVAKGEKRIREHTRKESTETETTVESESTSEDERSTQTTDRMEVKREVDRLIKEEASLKAGASLSASYGPAVEFKTYVDGATNSSREEAQKQSTNYSRETVQRAVSKVAERVLERRRTKTFVEIMEFNRTENDGLRDNESTIYQWVNKVYQSQVYNYGRRVIYDIMVPEPAASFIFSLRKGADNRPLDLEKPVPFNVAPAALTENNYQQYVIRYRAANVTPPPEPVRYIVKTFADSQTAPNQSKQHADKLEIPANYEAVLGRVSIALAVWTASPTPTVDTFFGNSSWRRTNGGYWTSPGLSLDYRTGEIATLATAINTPAYAISFDGMCRVSTAGVSAWKTRIHSELLAAYLLQLSKYESKLEEYNGTVMQNLFGRSPDENREIEKVELKKAATRLFLGTELDFGSVDKPADAFPTIDETKLSEQGRVIRFFEQAFEWDQMQYTFYPYYWGARDTWLDKILNRDQDSLFRNFLRSGAARVVLSVRPGFEELVAHYFMTGEVWAGGDIPQISDPEYVPILQEIREAQGQTSATEYGAPWTFTVPTTLAMLKENSSLPIWQKKEDGEWQQIR